MNHSATAPRFCSRGRWSALNIVLMIVGFAVFWPLGLAMLAWIIWGDEIRAKAEDAKEHFRSFSERAPRFRPAEGFGFQARTGNAAFDDYRIETLRRLDEERRRLEEEGRAFAEFVANLRRARDKEEFDRFMNERASRNQPDQN